MWVCLQKNSCYCGYFVVLGEQLLLITNASFVNDLVFCSRYCYYSAAVTDAIVVTVLLMLYFLKISLKIRGGGGFFLKSVLGIFFRRGEGGGAVLAKLSFPLHFYSKAP